MTTNPHILFVEDEPTVRTIGEDMLESFGCAVTAAENGQEALAALQSVRPDIILSDVRMPVMDGFKLLQEVRGNPTLQDMPFIIVSAKAESSDVRMGMALGADDYVTKPYQPADMQKAIAVRLERAKRLSQVREQQNRFLTHTLPHELLTPLTGVMGYADLMVELAADGRTLSVSEVAEYGHALQISGQRIYNIVENYLFWARLESARNGGGAAARPNVVAEDISYKDVSACVAGLAKRYDRREDVTVSCSLDAKIKVVTPGFLFVARHLIDNAFKYSLPGERIHVTVYQHGHLLRLRVVDSGRGMTAEQIARIGVFRQFDRDKFEQQGMGMGLSLVAMFAQLSGGSFHLEPGPNSRGLTASLRLPLIP